MPNWSAFAGIVGVVLTALLVLARLSQDLIDGRDALPATGESAVGDATARDGLADHRLTDRNGNPDGDGGLGPGALLANVALSQGAFGCFLLAGAWYARIPPTALGVDPAAPTLVAVGAGVALGGVLYLANEVGAALGERVGFGGASELRAALAPESRRGWAVLLLLVLPVIAGFEELLFRGALVGAMAAGFGVSPWAMAAVSAVAFAAGHGAQGPAGIAVTGLLGFVLAAAFVVTGSLLTVVVAHYLVNALEFLVHEWLDVGSYRSTD